MTEVPVWLWRHPAIQQGDHTAVVLTLTLPFQMTYGNHTTPPGRSRTDEHASDSVGTVGPDCQHIMNNINN